MMKHKMNNVQMMKWKSLVGYLSITGKNEVVESNVRIVLLPRTTIFSRVTRRIVSSPLMVFVIPLRNFVPNIFISNGINKFCNVILNFSLPLVMHFSIIQNIFLFCQKKNAMHVVVKWILDELSNKHRFVSP